MVKVRVIPEVGEVNVQDIENGPGRCERMACKKDLRRLRIHFICVLVKGGRSLPQMYTLEKPIPPEKLTVIPEDEEVKANQFVTGPGRCERFIKADENPPLKDIYNGVGRCEKEGCMKDVQRLRVHYREVHLKERTICRNATWGCSSSVTVIIWKAILDLSSVPNVNKEVAVCLG
ncbi:unnamed protein product [Orchesella dallaii]|uniref:C2H2-type domain-containing protein n=1 Tax=Orchesella dallaii TaxID=48710 RepID=A0ABP1QVI4_9HEXA